MKRIIVVSLLFFLQKTFAQTTVYTFNNGQFLNEKEIRSSFESVKRSLPSSLVLTTVIFHTTVKKDTTINYVSFDLDKGEAGLQTAEFNLSYKQDPTFLLLDKKLPYFKLKDLDGNEVFSTQLAGKPTLINFWAIYCGPCIEEMPWLSKLREKYKDKMNFISITENSESADNLKRFLGDKNFNFQVLENGQAYKDELKISALPRNLFLDKNGVLKFIQGNYPVANSAPLEINDEANYFTRIIEELLINK